MDNLDRPSENSIRTIRFVPDMNVVCKTLSNHYTGKLWLFSAVMFVIGLASLSRPVASVILAVPAFALSLMFAFVCLTFPLRIKKILDKDNSQWLFRCHRFMEFDNDFFWVTFDNGYRSRMPWEIAYEVQIQAAVIEIYFLAKNQTPLQIQRSAFPDQADERRLFELMRSKNLMPAKFPDRI